ncbi:hypothetical protein DSM104299_05364 [Baekduia alba]|uniref:hypothetical protein n=1 Tax=Baekduia alba TaxID=2997333 RepID=UPI002340655D|nr:hypothetical protein [Baekduia alba]WCB96600.1 hypothetical protein DSM104299_05364 [Baekduia alba]
MASLTIRRRKTKSQRAASAAGKAGSAAWTFVKARVAWVAGKKAAKVAVPAAAVGTAAVVAKKRSGHSDAPPEPTAVNGTPKAPAGVA